MWTRLTPSSCPLTPACSQPAPFNILQNDLLAAFVVLLGLLCAAALHMQAQWPAGLAALLLFAPYFFDARL